MTEASKPSRPVGGRLEASVRRRPLLARLEAPQDKSGPYGKLIREAAAEVRASQESRRAARIPIVLIDLSSSRARR